MEILFLNRLSKRNEQGHELFAQVWIGQHDGVWSAGWSTQHSLDESTDDLWYEGSLWQELLHVYRHELALKMAEGYRPLIHGVFHEQEGAGAAGRGQTLQKLYCYSDLFPRDDVYEQLTMWRRQKAAAERKAPYFIATNRLLRLISVYLPHTEEELLELPGMGQGKISQYGPELLAITTQNDRTTPFPLNWVTETLDEEVFLSWLYKQKETQYKQELNKFSLTKTIIEGISDGLTLEHIGLKAGLHRREMIEAVEHLDRDGIDMEKLIRQELVNVSEEEQTAIWSAYEELGDALLKPVMLRVYGEEQAAETGLDQVYERLRLIRIRFRHQVASDRHAG
ncbi:HRDC domain-containing protein [Paenibacillus terrae]|uniref:Helicase n=1 Tax=Paenibacillus terrae TaxID=159743 RepID=A0A0D7WZQ8_9BACL|nr:HRDC domain-containing protein [Paenibacillus terrae]KJD44208.1 helicase [Paenibacillus terrae]